MKKLIFTGILFVSVFGIYFRAIDNPLEFDSASVASYGPMSVGDAIRSTIGTVLDYSKSGLTAYGRTLNGFSFSVLSKWGLKTQHFANIILHFLNSILLCVFLKKLYSQRTAVFVSLFFAVNPAAIYSVCYLIERSQLLMFFFGVIQCLFYLRALQSRWWLSPVWFLASLVSYKLALISKEHSIIFIAIYPLLSLAHRENWKRSILYCSVICGFALMLVQKIPHQIFGDLNEYYENIVTCPEILDKTNIHFRSVLTQAGLFFKYFFHWVMPVPTSIDMRVEFASSTKDIGGLVCFLVYVLGSIGLAIKKSTRYLGCGLLMAACFFLPEFSRARDGEIFVLYRSYIYALAYMIVIGWGVERLKDKWALPAVLFIFAAVTFARVPMFDSGSRLWTQAADLIDLSNPRLACQAPRAFNNAGGSLLQEGRTQEAIQYFKIATALAPEWGAPSSNLGVAYYFLGDFASSKAVFSDLMKRDLPGDMSTQAKAFLQDIQRKEQSELR